MISPPLMHLLNLETKQQAETSTLEQIIVSFYLSNLQNLILMIEIVDLVQRLKVINRLSRQQWTNEQPSYPQEMDTDLNY